MKASEAPPAGWYPDPRKGARLRWWDGTDWTDIFRSPPEAAEVEAFAAASRAAARAAMPTSPSVPPGRETSGLSRQDSEEIISQVRQVARSEIERAADLFSARAQAATRSIEPLITQYSNRLLRLVRIAVIVAIVLLVGWFFFQVVLQASLFEWIGDRIDNLTNKE